MIDNIYLHLVPLLGLLYCPNSLTNTYMSCYFIRRHSLWGYECHVREVLGRETEPEPVKPSRRRGTRDSVFPFVRFLESLIFFFLLLSVLDEGAALLLLGVVS